jgi:hypothetical protein
MVSGNTLAQVVTLATKSLPARMRLSKGAHILLPLELSLQTMQC